MKRMLSQISALLVILLITGAYAHGQADKATITGFVSDSSGAAVPGVKVVVRNTATGAAFNTVTNEVGIYNVSSLPAGTYTLQVSQAGFKEYLRNDVQLVVAQVAQINVKLEVGSVTEAVTVSGAEPLLETQTSTAATGLLEAPMRDLPLNAAGGRDALNLLIQAAPTVSGSAESPSNNLTLHIAGGQLVSSSIYIDGVESSSGFYGDTATPGLDALQEEQVQTNGISAQLGATGSGVVMYELKSGTNKFHGSAFDFLQNEFLNANTWSNNQFLAACGPSDTACQSQYRRPRYRFNDYGFSAGGPIWKNHTFIFGDFEYYNQTDHRLTPNALTVPTAQMLTGDFSQLLTGGTQQGSIPDPNNPGQAWINPCTGLPYQYGQIFDPATQKQVGGVTCATPFAGNIIPTARLSTVAQKVAAIYTKYYPPTNSNLYNNFPSMLSASPYTTKSNIDIKLDHYFSSVHHFSFGFDYAKFYAENSNNGSGCISYSLNNGPFNCGYDGNYPYYNYRIIDNYSFTPQLVNNLAIGYSERLDYEHPHVLVNPSDYGFNNPDSTVFPVLGFGGSNGVGISRNSITTDDDYNYYALHLQDTVTWQKGRHTLAFGGAFVAPGTNTTWGGNVQDYNFANDTGGPTAAALNNYVGNGFASFMLGNVQSAGEQVLNAAYPRQKYLEAFAQDDIKVNPRLTVNLGLDWDYYLRGKSATGQWTNFDLTAQNPNWAPYYGAWTFATNSGSSFYKNEYPWEFGPHVGVAYQLTSKLVARGAYGLFHDPLDAFATGFSNYYPPNQTWFFFGTNNVPNSVEGSTAFNLDSGYPGQTQYLARSISQTDIPQGYLNYMGPDFLKLGHVQNFNVGVEYEIAHNVLLDARYIGHRGGGLRDESMSVYKNYPSWSTYQPLLLSGNINNSITDPASAAAAGVPYPYANFSGPAYAAISPYPQLASLGASVWSWGDSSSDSGVDAYNAFVAEVKTRNAHGLNVDFSYTLSKITGSNIAGGNWTTWGYGYQSFDDIAASRNWVEGYDQRHVAKGYITYDLPFGRGRQFLNQSAWLDEAVGGWTLGYVGNYASGNPVGTVSAAYSLPNYYSTLRANFANGATATNMKNQFGGHLDLINANDSSNQDFNPNLFTSPTLGTLGNTPYIWDHWRWNSQRAMENLSLLKHFTFGKDGRFRGSLRAEFYNVFNRHYFNSPDTGLGDATFGQILGISTPSRTGQLGARFEW